MRETKAIMFCLLLSTMFLFFSLSPLPTAASTGEIGIYIDGDRVSSDARPFIDSNGRTLVPLRVIAEDLGAGVGWDSSEKKVSISLGGKHIELRIGQSTALINGKESPMDTAAVVRSSRTMVPLRFIGENLNCKVDWEPDERAVYIKKITPPQVQGQVTVTASRANIRRDPSTNNDPVTQVDNGTVLDVLGSSGGWYEVLLKNGERGWIFGEIVTTGKDSPPKKDPPEDPAEKPSPPTAAGGTSGRTAVVVGNSANIRQGPSTNHPILYESFKGRELEVLDEQGTWYKVKDRNSPEGWIAGWLVAIKEGSSLSKGTGGDSSRGGETTGRITEFYHDISQDETTAFIKASGEIKYQYNTLTNPDRVVVDILGARLGADLDGAKSIDLPRGPVNNIRYSQFDRDIVRFVFQSTKPIGAKFELGNKGQELAVNFSEAPLQGKVIVIDPGHGSVQPGGWSDPGAVGHSGLYERDVVTEIAKVTGDNLLSQGASVIYTRTWDTAAGLTDRADIANRYGADIFVSIHCNASTSPLLSGTSTYFYAPSSLPPGAREERRRLASLVQDELLRSLGRRNLGIREDNFAVLRNTKMPSILVETAFISNPEEERLLGSKSFQEKAGKAIARGVQRYFGL
ncbi:MAG: SH3 domain-containing protein [Clostridia bacterium]|nr:SH3 domain-containing protein [Clostridia bacterium]